VNSRRGQAVEGGTEGAPLRARPQVGPHHVGISVADLEASIAWYEDNLGFSLESIVPVPEDEGRVAMLVNESGFRVELFELPGAAPPPDGRRHPATDLRTQGVKHMAYAVTDIEAWEDRLRAAGADIVWDVRLHEDVKVLFVRDNTGNLVELVEPLEPDDNETSERRLRRSTEHTQPQARSERT
jgi:methylmalonyl-CoA/ethylmalonyl-CoA epimerase